MFNSWASIGGFHNVHKVLKDYPNLHEGAIAYRAKVKLHGNCGGIAIAPDGTVTAQSRTIVLTANEDSKGFAKWVAENNDYWSNLAGDEVITVFGEWCGPGIQKGTAINKIPNKVFAVFAIQFGDAVLDEFAYEHATIIIEPLIIERMLAETPEGVLVLPWYGEGIIVDYSDTPSMEAAVTIMNGVVETVEGNDPWVKETFGIEGMGEGVVYYPINFQSGGSFDRWHMSTFSFKAKGEKHKVVKTKEAVQIDPEVASSIDDFVAMVVTDARLEQGAREVAGGEFNFSHKSIGPFLKWVGQDVQKETADELAASDLDWKQVVKPISTAARVWYLHKIEEL